MENFKLPFRGRGYKKLQAGKPDSVVGYHLSVLTITCQHQSAYPVSRTSSPQTILYVAFQHARFTLN
jgi:hypothetical protein